MEVLIKTKFNRGDRVWMPDGNGGKIAGRVMGLVLFRAELSESPERIVSQSLNYHCVDIDRKSLCSTNTNLKKDSFRFYLANYDTGIKNRRDNFFVTH